MEFLRDICCRQDDNFSKELHVYFSRTMPGLILHELQQHGFIGIECVLGWPACIPNLSPIGNVWRIMKRRIRQKQPQTVEQLKSCIHHGWEKNPLAKLQRLISSVPKRLQSNHVRMGEKNKSKWNDCCARQGGFSISETEIAENTAKKQKASSEQQFCRQKCIASERGQRRMAGLVEADRKVTVT